jgi:hypothetical protein
LHSMLFHSVTTQCPDHLKTHRHRATFRYWTERHHQPPRIRLFRPTRLPARLWALPPRHAHTSRQILPRRPKRRNWPSVRPQCHGKSPSFDNQQDAQSAATGAAALPPRRGAQVLPRRSNAQHGRHASVLGVELGTSLPPWRKTGDLGDKPPSNLRVVGCCA